MKKETVTELTLCAVLLVVATGMVSIRYFAKYESAQNARLTAIETLSSAQHEALTQAQTEIAALLDANKAVAQTLKDEAEKRVAAEQAALQAQVQISQLQKSSTNLSTLIAQWRPLIAYVKCTWNISASVTATKSGTAVLMPRAGSSAAELITNRHVVTYQNAVANSCTLRFPNQADEPTITENNITLSGQTTDWAKIHIPNPSLPVRSLNSSGVSRCVSTPTIGEEIVILGYPGIGAREDITATEGIISGFDDEYYITSAKVERGNSGGAAVHVKQNCYLGIPTFVDAGVIESLARILDHRIVP